MSKKEVKNKDLNTEKTTQTSKAKAQNKGVSKQSKTKANKTPCKSTQQDKRIRLSKEDRKEQILMLSLKVFNQKGFLNTTMEDIVRASELSKGGVYYHYQNTIDILHDLMVLGIKYRVNIIKDSILKSQTDTNSQKQDENQTKKSQTTSFQTNEIQNNLNKNQIAENQGDQTNKNIQNQATNSKNHPTNEIQTITKNTEQNTQNKLNLDFYANELYKKIITKNDFMDIYVQFLYAKKDSPKLENLFYELKELNKQEFKAAFGDTRALEKNYDFLTDFINSLILGANILNSNELFKTNEILIKEMFKLILKED